MNGRKKALKHISKIVSIFKNRRTQVQDAYILENTVSRLRKIVYYTFLYILAFFIQTNVSMGDLNP